VQCFRQLRRADAAVAGLDAGQYRLLLSGHIRHRMPPEIENENRFQIIAENPRLSTAFFERRYTGKRGINGTLTSD
jgi:hypothetical protein